MARRKQRDWVMYVTIAVIFLILGMFMTSCAVFVRWRNLDDRGTDDGNATTTPEPDCVKILLLGQDCSDEGEDGCCEEGTTCSSTFLFEYECKYVRPVCDNVLYEDWYIPEGRTYEDVITGISWWEVQPQVVDWMESKGYAYHLEQCMDNHAEYIDYCCRCPDGTSQRFVYDGSTQPPIEYMWCFVNPSG